MKTGDKTRTGGLNQTEVDARVTTLAAESALAENAGKLKRVDTGAWEAPQAAVVYYAPPEAYLRKAGIAAGKARRLYFGATADGATVVASGVVDLIGQHIDSTDTNPTPDRNMSADGGVAGSSNYVFLYQEVGADTIKARAAGTFTIVSGWVEYKVA